MWGLIQKEGVFMQRNDGRGLGELRPVKITRNYLKYAEGSCLIEIGETKVICSASVEEKVPPFLRDTGTGWVTAEYGMLPRSTKRRIFREAAKGKMGGRTQEIQRIIGRCLRAVTRFEALGERTIWMDCDVIQADGGTRTAAITGSFVALIDALAELQKEHILDNVPVTDFVAAVSVGICKGEPILDLNYEEDSKAEVDMNVAMTAGNEFVEIQGTAESRPFSKERMEDLLALAKKGIGKLIDIQKQALGKRALQIGKDGTRYCH